MAAILRMISSVVAVASGKKPAIPTKPLTAPVVIATRRAVDGLVAQAVCSWPTMAMSNARRSAASAIPFSWTVMPAGIFRLRQPAATAEPNRPPSMSATRTTRPLLFSKRRTDASSAA